MSRQIVVIRHGKAEAHSSEDFGRVLAARGRNDSTRLGAWLGSQDLDTPARAYVSAAARAQQTWDGVRPGLGGLDVEVDVTESLYDAGPDAVLEVVAATPPEVRTVFVVGHNPTMAGVVGSLADATSPAGDAFERRGLPTAACAIVECDTWDDPRGAVRVFVTPDDY